MKYSYCKIVLDGYMFIPKWDAQF